MNVNVSTLKIMFGEIADAISMADIPQTEREKLAESVADALETIPRFNRPSWQLIASDPLCECAGHDGKPCPSGMKIRVGMHLSSAPDGRSEAWRMEKPEIRCFGCGMAHHRGVNLTT